MKLMDTDLGKFLPAPEDSLELLAKRLRISESDCAAKLAVLNDATNMLNFRGCRLSVMYPEITEMQCVSAAGNSRYSTLNLRSMHRIMLWYCTFIDAALKAKSEGCLVKLKIILPRVVLESEVSALIPGLQSSIERLFSERNSSIVHEFGDNYRSSCLSFILIRFCFSGVMIQLPRACLQADSIVAVHGISFAIFDTAELTMVPTVSNIYLN